MQGEKDLVKTYRGFRKKPIIYGMNTIAFLIFVGISLCALLSLLSGLSVTKVIVVLSIIGLTYLICSLLSASEKIQEILFDEKLPLEYSDDEE